MSDQISGETDANGKPYHWLWNRKLTQHDRDKIEHWPYCRSCGEPLDRATGICRNGHPMPDDHFTLGNL